MAENEKQNSTATSTDIYEKALKPYPNAELNPIEHERVYLYSFLYNEILNNMPDYGFPNNTAVSPEIDDVIYKYMTWLKAIEDGDSIDSLGLSAQEKKNVEKWRGKFVGKGYNTGLVPLWKAGDVDPLDKEHPAPLTEEEARKKNSAYIKDFTDNFEKSREKSKELSMDIGKGENVLSFEDTMIFLKTKTKLIKKTWNDHRLLIEEKEGRLKRGEDGNFSVDQGSVLTDYQNAKRELSKKNRTIRLGFLKGFLKTVGAIAFAGVTVMSGFGLLSFGGFALTSALGAALQGAGVGGAFLCAGGILGGGIFTKKLFGSLIEEIHKNRKFRKDRYNYKHELGEYGHDPKKKESLKSIRERYFKAVAVKKFLETGDYNKVPRKYRKYISKGKMLEDYKKDSAYYRFVDTKGAGMKRLEACYSHYVTKVEGQGVMSAADLTVLVKQTLKKDSPSLEELADLARRIDDNATNAPDGSKISVENRNLLNKRISEKLVVAVNGEIFENSYSGSTKISDLLNSKYVASRLGDDTLMHGEKRRINDSISLLSSIEKDCERIGDYNVTLSRDVNVNVKAQLSFDNTTMLNACENLSKDADGNVTLSETERIEIESVINNLNSATTKSDVRDIDIDTLSIPETSKKYLNFMKTKRENQLTNGKEDIYESIRGHGEDIELDAYKLTVQYAKIKEISEKIADLRFSDLASVDASKKSKLQEIREMIFEKDGGGNFIISDENERNSALNALDIQIRSLEKQRRDESREKVIKAVENGELNVNNGKEEKTSLKDILEQISAKKYEDIRDNYLFGSVILKVTPIEIKNYLIDVYRLQIEKICIKELNDNKSKYTTADGALDAAITFLGNVSDCSAINQSQKDRLYEMMGKYLEIALGNTINEDKKNFAVLANNNSLKLSKYTTWLEKSYGGHGLKEFFNSRNPIAEQLKDKVEYMSRLGSLVEMLRVPADGQDLKESENESLAFSAIYLLNKESRTTGDQLFDSLSSMKQIFDRNKSVNFTVTAMESSDFVINMKNELARISTFTDENDKYAALLILKKRCLATYKMHAIQYLRDKGVSNYESHFNTPANVTDFENEVFNKWCGTGDTCLLSRIDDELARCASLPIYAKYTPTSAVDIATKAKGQTTVMNFYQGNQLS